MTPQSITVYTFKLSTYGHRVEIGLAEANASFRKYEIDFLNKPAWFKNEVNPVNKIPAITYGGPDVAPDQPSSESFKLAESAIILEFIHDLYPAAQLLPSDPVALAKARFFIDFLSTAYTSAFAPLMTGRPDAVAPFLAACESVQARLAPISEGPWVLGAQFSVADIALLPFTLRAELFLRTGVTADAAQAAEAWAALQTPRFERLNALTRAGRARKSVQETFNEDAVVEQARALLAAMKARAAKE